MCQLKDFCNHSEHNFAAVSKKEEKQFGPWVSKCGENGCLTDPTFNKWKMADALDNGEMQKIFPSVTLSAHMTAVVRIVEHKATHCLSIDQRHFFAHHCSASSDDGTKTLFLATPSTAPDNGFFGRGEEPCVAFLIDWAAVPRGPLGIQHLRRLELPTDRGLLLKMPLYNSNCDCFVVIEHPLQETDTTSLRFWIDAKTGAVKRIGCAVSSTRSCSDNPTSKHVFAHDWRTLPPYRLSDGRSWHVAELCPFARWGGFLVVTKGSPNIDIRDAVWCTDSAFECNSEDHAQSKRLLVRSPVNHRANYKTGYTHFRPEGLRLSRGSDILALPWTYPEPLTFFRMQLSFGSP